jgi:hypothetical protein
MRFLDLFCANVRLAAAVRALAAALVAKIAEPARRSGSRVSSALKYAPHDPFDANCSVTEMIVDKGSYLHFCHGQVAG